MVMNWRQKGIRARPRRLAGGGEKAFLSPSNFRGIKRGRWQGGVTFDPARAPPREAEGQVAVPPTTRAAGMPPQDGTPMSRWRDSTFLERPQDREELLRGGEETTGPPAPPEPRPRTCCLATCAFVFTETPLPLARLWVGEEYHRRRLPRPHWPCALPPPMAPHTSRFLRRCLCAVAKEPLEEVCVAAVAAARALTRWLAATARREPRTDAVCTDPVRRAPAWRCRLAHPQCVRQKQQIALGREVVAVCPFAALTNYLTKPVRALRPPSNRDQQTRVSHVGWRCGPVRAAAHGQ